ncbi:MAG: hypothetical protein IIU60_01930, partial [Paraprevotella sp.]|nr:hypothetical protein [Paraprevotella sp.]
SSTALRYVQRRLPTLPRYWRVGAWCYDLRNVLESIRIGNVVSNKIFKSTDCLTWEEVADVPAAFSARRHTVGVAQGNSAWLFGGISDVTNDTYGYPLAEPFTPVTETWVKKLD